jgi:hypothetical protein
MTLAEVSTDILIVLCALVGSIAVFKSTRRGVILLVLLIVPFAIYENDVIRIALLVAHTVVTISWLKDLLKGEEYGVRHDVIIYLIIAFISYILLHIVYSSVADQGDINALKKAYIFLLLTISIIVGRFIDLRGLKHILYSIVYVGTFVSLICIVSNVLNGSYILQSSDSQAFASPVYLYSVPGALVMYKNSRRIGLRILSFICFLLVFWRVLIGFNTQPIVITIASVLLLLLLTAISRSLKISQVVYYGCLLLFTSLSLILLLQYVSDVSLFYKYENEILGIGLERDFSLRIDQYNTAFVKAKESLIFGNGAHFDYYTISFPGMSPSRINNVHSLYAYTLVYFGVFGLLFVMSILLKSLHRGFWYLRRMSLGWLNDLVIFGTVIITITLLLGLFSTKSHSVEAWLITSIGVGLVVLPFQRRILA